jgi:hypothetical protein
MDCLFFVLVVGQVGFGLRACEKRIYGAWTSFVHFRILVLAFRLPRKSLYFRRQAVNCKVCILTLLTILDQYMTIGPEGE